MSEAPIVPYRLRPVFVGWIALVAQLPLQLFLTVWAGGFFGGFTSGFLGLPGLATYATFGAAAFLLVPSIAFFGKKLNYGCTVYTFQDDHLEFEEGYFSQNRKNVRYRDILEVTLRKGLLQRSCDLGTIYLGTLATGSGSRSNAFRALGFGNISASGISIVDIQDPDRAYGHIRALIDAAKAGRRD